MTIEKLRADMIAAMKAKDKVRKDVVSLVVKFSQVRMRSASSVFIKS